MNRPLPVMPIRKTLPVAPSLAAFHIEKNGRRMVHLVESAGGGSTDGM